MSAAVGAWARRGLTSNLRLLRLQQAAAAGHNDVVTELIEAGLLVDAAAEDGRTALIIAAAADQAATVRIILSMGASPRARIHGDCLTAAHIAAARNGVRVLTCLLDADARLGNVSDSAGLTPLHHACANGHAEAVDMLLVTFGFAVDVQAASADGATPLALAACCGSQPCVKVLIEHGAQVEAADKAGETALHRACAAGHLPVAALLLDAGASMFRENRRGETAADGDRCGPQMCDLSSTRRRTSRPVVGSLQLLKERPVPLVPGIPAGRGTHDECCVPLSSVSEETAALRIVARRGARIPRFSLYYEGPLDSPSPLALFFRPASPAVRTRAPARDGWRSVRLLRNYGFTDLPPSLPLLRLRSGHAHLKIKSEPARTPTCDV